MNSEEVKAVPMEKQDAGIGGACVQPNSGKKKRNRGRRNSAKKSAEEPASKVEGTKPDMAPRGDGEESTKKVVERKESKGQTNPQRERKGSASQKGPTPQNTPGSSSGKGQNPRNQRPNPKGPTPQSYPGSSSGRGENPRNQRQNPPGSGRGPRGQRPNHTPQSANKRRQVFEPYFSQEVVSAALKRGLFIEGALRINPKNYEDAYVPHPDGISDIYICGLKKRNRALNGDQVVIAIDPREEWKVLTEEVGLSHRDISNGLKELSLEDSSDAKSKAEESTKTVDNETSKQTSSDDLQPGAFNLFKDRKADSATNQLPDSGSGSGPGSGKAKIQTPKQSNQRGTPQGTPNSKYTTLKDFVASPVAAKSEAVRKLFDESSDTSSAEKKDGNTKKMEAVPNNLLLRTGKVVFIVERKHSRACTGHIKLMNDKNPNWALFAPIDHRAPRIMIPMSDCPKDFFQRPEDHTKTLFIARVTEWDENSQFAKGTLAKSLGEAGEIEPETEGILIENGIDFNEFPEEALECLPQDLPWSIPEKEFSYRKDLREECIFTIDPATARDLDDALHFTDLGDGVYEVGVHIADVSFFVEFGSALDHVAADRSTSVYMVQKVIPMLPRLLCEQLCSLNPGQDRLAFSVIWKMRETGEILDEWFGRTVIRSCVKLGYNHAQGFIEEPEKVCTTEELPEISGKYSTSVIRDKVLGLNKIAVNLRQNRFDNGALRLNQVKLQYTLDKDTMMPNGYFVYQQRDSNKLVEEFMLLANMAVAHKTYKAFPDIALLRRHPQPQQKMVDDLMKTCEGLGIEIDASSSKSLQRSLEQFPGVDEEALAKMQILVVMCSKPMQFARYFCTGVLEDEALYCHYALSVPLYLHFTSPIRRYPDVMAHRLLAASLGYCDPPHLKKEAVQKQADHCNDKKQASKRVQELSLEMYFAVFVKECGPLEEKGMVMAVLDKSFDVLILKLGVIKRVYMERLDLKYFNFTKRQNRPELTLTWNANEKHDLEVEQRLGIFSRVNCILVSDDAPLKWNALIKHPKEKLNSAEGTV